MNRTNVAAYNAGVRAVLDLAERTAARFEASGQRQLHIGFAVEALRALVAEEPALRLNDQPAATMEERHDAR
ncbi:hypothetical protein [Lichenihabitans psoromatis]|uniref:hypothetical protein n=1 Tax=Lichenihabitans psoromatis TaxID=2528642 RepID=UPI001036927D|nr:hypothetical protein [Lichenihabitans psoromatis]